MAFAVLNRRRMRMEYPKDGQFVNTKGCTIAMSRNDPLPAINYGKKEIGLQKYNQRLQGHQVA